MHYQSRLVLLGLFLTFSAPFIVIAETNSTCFWLSSGAVAVLLCDAVCVAVAVEHLLLLLGEALIFGSCGHGARHVADEFDYGETDVVVIVFLLGEGVGSFSVPDEIWLLEQSSARSSIKELVGLRIVNIADQVNMCLLDLQDISV